MPLNAEELEVGGEYELRVHLINRSRGTLQVESLDLIWNLGERRTGGAIPIEGAEIEARSRQTVYAVKGEWSPMQDRGGATLEAVIRLAGGDALQTALSW